MSDRCRIALSSDPRNVYAPTHRCDLTHGHDGPHRATKVFEWDDGAPGQCEVLGVIKYNTETGETATEAP